MLKSSSEVRRFSANKENGSKERKKETKTETTHGCYADIPGSAHSDGWLRSLQISVMAAVAVERFPWSLLLLQG